MMSDPIHVSGKSPPKGCVIVLHCSLGSGRQWARLIGQFGDRYKAIAPDISGYGDHQRPFDLPTTLEEEVALLNDRLPRLSGPIHLVGHSYGGAVAFKIATASRLASRVRSLTLIEPVLPTLLKDSAADRRLHDRFAELALGTYGDLWNGLFMEALDRFIDFWNGSGPPQKLSPGARLRMIEQVEKIAFDFSAVLAEENVAAAAATLRVPTLLFSGGLSPYLTQRIVARLASIIAGADARHLPAAGHMLPFTHAELIHAEIVRHIRRADNLATLSLVSSRDGEKTRNIEGDAQSGQAASSAC
jgi:pimeloyl-ACP methyl ester carboxylesterase